MTRVGDYRIDRPVRAVGAVKRYTGQYENCGAAIANEGYPCPECSGIPTPE